MVFIPHDQPVEVMLWMNGMVMVFNSAGEQLPDYQGRWTYALPKLLAQPTAKLITWKVGVWKEWLEPVTLEQVSTLARVFTVDGPMVEAAARAEHDFDRGANVVNLGWEETTSAMRDHCRTRAARGLDAALGLRR